MTDTPSLNHCQPTQHLSPFFPPISPHHRFFNRQVPTKAALTRPNRSRLDRRPVSSRVYSTGTCCRRRRRAPYYASARGFCVGRPGLSCPRRRGAAEYSRGDCPSEECLRRRGLVLATQLTACMCLCLCVCVYVYSPRVFSSSLNHRRRRGPFYNPLFRSSTPRAHFSLAFFPPRSRN